MKLIEIKFYKRFSRGDPGTVRKQQRFRKQLWQFFFN